MLERRTNSRYRTFKPGTISFNRAGVISCVIRNLSVTGACPEVASPIGIPDDFTLVIESDHIQRICHVA